MSVKLLMTYVDSEGERLTFSADLEELGDIEEYESQTIAPEFEGKEFQLKNISIAKPIGLSKILPTQPFGSFVAPDGQLSQERIDILLEGDVIDHHAHLAVTNARLQRVRDGGGDLSGPSCDKPICRFS